MSRHTPTRAPAPKPSGAPPAGGVAEAAPYLMLTLTVLLWGGNYVVGRGMQAEVPPFAMGFWRWAIPTLLLAPLLVAGLRDHWPQIRAEWRTLLAAGCLGVGACGTLVYAGLRYTTAVNASLLSTATPVLTVLIAAWLIGERLRRVQAGGVALSALGAVVIVLRGEPANLLALRINAGDLLCLASCLIWAFYTVMLRKRPTRLSGLLFLAITAAIGAAVNAPLHLWEWAGGTRPNASLAALATLAYVGIAPSLIGFFLWNRAVEQVGAGRAGVFVHLLPVFATLLAVIFLDERIEPFHYAGAALVACGIYLATARRFAAAPQPSEGRSTK